MSGALAGWTRLALGDIGAAGHFGDGDWVESKDQDAKGTVRLTQLADVGVGRFRNRSDRWMREDQAKRLGCTFLQPNDVLIARMPDPIGRACLVPENIGRAVTAVDVAILRSDTSQFDPRYVMWALNSPSVHGDIVKLQSGTTRKRVSRRNLERVYLGVPPLTEQRRIVEILEDHLSRLDTADQYLVGAARRMRAGVTASLAQMWNAAAALAEPSPVNTFGRVVTGSTPSARISGAYGDDLPFVTPSDVGHGGQVQSTRRGLSSRGAATARVVGPDAVLVVCIGATLGKVGSIDHGVATNQQINAVQLLGSTTSAPFVAQMMASPRFQSAMRASATTTTIPLLNKSAFSGLAVPLPAPAAQVELLARHDHIQDQLQRLAEASAAAEARASSLRRALLRNAFAGRLTGRASDMDLAEELATSGLSA